MVTVTLVQPIWKYKLMSTFKEDSEREQANTIFNELNCSVWKMSFIHNKFLNIEILKRLMSCYLVEKDITMSLKWSEIQIIEYTQEVTIFLIQLVNNV